ncbi:hypothetical protein Tco_1543722, partial [Tanacetum coccineum]
DGNNGWVYGGDVVAREGGFEVGGVGTCDEVVVARKLFEETCMVICEDKTDMGYDLGGDNVFV